MNATGQAPILSLASVRVSFDGLAVLDDLDFSMERGELRFLIGPNGAGKTTMLDIITGRTRPASGEVIYDGGTDLTRTKEYELAKLGIARKFQTPAVFGSLTVLENLDVEVATGKTSITRFSLVPSDEVQAKMSVMSAVGSAVAAGPSW